MVAKHHSIPLGNVTILLFLRKYTLWLKAVCPSLKVSDGGTSSVKVEQGKACARSEPPTTEAEPKQMTASSPELTQLIQCILTFTSTCLALAAPAVVLDRSAANPPLTATTMMSIMTKKTLWT